MEVVLWAMTPCSLVYEYQCFRGTYASIFRYMIVSLPEDDDNIIPDYLYMLLYS
jgi:hypothetical protein